MKERPAPDREGPSPAEVHPYEFASRRTSFLFFRLAKRALLILALIVLLGILLIFIVSKI